VAALMTALPFILAHDSSLHSSPWKAFGLIPQEYINARAKYVAEMHV